MKLHKLFLIIILFIISHQSEAQGLTDTLGNTKRTLTDIYNEIYGTSITAMSDVCQYYTVTINPASDTQKVLVSREADLSPSWQKDGNNKYVGKFRASDYPDLWLRSWYTVASTFTYTVEFIEIIR